jgi:hypothetical protein
MGDEVQPEDSPERMLQLAQLEQLQLRNERLKFKLASVGRQKPWYTVPTQMSAMITALVAFAGFAWGLVQYGREQRRNREALHDQSVREQETAEREFMKPWLESQRETYLQALTAAGTIPNSEDSKARKQATDDFWRLYQGKMILVETKSVSGAMVHYGHCLDGTEVCDREELNTRCRALATAMAGSMAATAKMTFKEFADNQFRYSSGP